MCDRMFVAGSDESRRLRETDGLAAMITVSAGKRQDDVTVQSYGQIGWISHPDDVSQSG